MIRMCFCFLPEIESNIPLRKVGKPMSAPYPKPASMFRLIIPTLLFVQFFISPLSWQVSRYAGISAAQITLLSIVLLAVLVQRLTPEDVLLLNAFHLSQLITILVAAVTASISISYFDHFVYRILYVLGFEIPAQVQARLLEFHLARRPFDVAAAIMAVGILPAVSEELVFRGYVLTSLYYHRGKYPAVLGSAVLFAAAHMNPWQFPALWLYGIVLGILALSTNSIYVPILFHVVNNSMAFGWINLRAYTGLSLYDLPLFLSIGITMICIITLLFCLIQLHDRHRRVPL